MEIERLKAESMRDYFAAAALTGLLASEACLPSMIEDGVHPGWAETAYVLADAMLEARKPK